MVCFPKDCEGFVLKIQRCSSLFLVFKWDWRCLEDREAIWYGLPSHRFGNLIDICSSHAGTLNHSQNYSPWWCDLLSLGGIFMGLFSVSLQKECTIVEFGPSFNLRENMDLVLARTTIPIGTRIFG